MNYYEIPADAGPAGVAVAKQVKSVVVMYPAYQQALQACVATVNLSRSVGLASGLIVQADAGMGKTLLSQLLSQELTKVHAGMEPPKVPLISLDSGADVHQVAAKVAAAVGYPHLPSSSRLANITNMVDLALERLKPKALIFDESQHLCEGNREIRSKEATDWLKVRMDKHSVACVLIGERAIERLYEINNQFVSRASAGYVLEPIAFGDGWISVLGGFMDQIKGYDLSILKEVKVARPLHTITRGTFRELKGVLMHSLISTARDGREKLLVADLAIGCDRTFGARGDRPNPYAKARP